MAAGVPGDGAEGLHEPSALRPVRLPQVPLMALWGRQPRPLSGRRDPNESVITAEPSYRTLPPAPAHPRETCAHHLFEAAAARDPGAAAVSLAGVETSFAELERRANGVAARLRAVGVGPESRVAVLMERGPELAAALLGVLKAGGAYVPIDPEYPAERTAWVLED